MIKMFVVSSSKGEDKDIEIAYEHSINKNCSEDVKIEWMRQSDDPTSYWGCWQTHTWPTPFSGFRWGIACLLYTSPSPRDQRGSRMPSSA